MKIHTGKTIMPRRLFAYGPEGIGKSTFANDAPETIFIDTEGGLNDIVVNGKFDTVKNYAELLNQIGFLYHESHEYKTVCIDTVDWMEKRIHEGACSIHGWSTIEDLKFQKGYYEAEKLWKQILTFLDMLRNDKSMNIILLAHEAIEHFKNPETDTYDRYVPKIHKFARNMLLEWCDEVFYLSEEILTIAKKETFGTERNLGIGTGNRIINTQGKPAFLAKNRLGLPEKLPLKWNEYQNFWNGEQADGKS